MSNGVERGAIAKQRLRTPAETAIEEEALKIHTRPRFTPTIYMFYNPLIFWEHSLVTVFFFFPPCVTLSTTPFLLHASHANTVVRLFC